MHLFRGCILKFDRKAQITIIPLKVGVRKFWHVVQKLSPAPEPTQNYLYSGPTQFSGLWIYFLPPFSQKYWFWLKRVIKPSLAHFFEILCRNIRVISKEKIELNKVLGAPRVGRFSLYKMVYFIFFKK